MKEENMVKENMAPWFEMLFLKHRYPRHYNPETTPDNPTPDFSREMVWENHGRKPQVLVLYILIS
jgi:hypothetical protein